MLEVEMKFPVADLQLLKEKLLSLGALFRLDQVEEDIYLNAPDRDYASTDEALRLRRAGESWSLEYKGPKLDAGTKTREELGAELLDELASNQMLELLLRLRYRPVAMIRKYRSVFDLNHLDFGVGVCLDRVDGVGSFAEIEIRTDVEHGDAAREAVQDLARRLGLTNSERRSYLEMWLEKHDPSANR